MMGDDRGTISKGILTPNGNRKPLLFIPFFQLGEDGEDRLGKLYSLATHGAACYQPASVSRKRRKLRQFFTHTDFRRKPVWNSMFVGEDESAGILTLRSPCPLARHPANLHRYQPLQCPYPGRSGAPVSTERQAERYSQLLAGTTRDEGVF